MVKVTTIPAKTIANANTGTDAEAQLVLRRVAGYARVSTDHDDQTNSYQAQIDYYTAYINNRADWQLAGIYTDEGLSGTSTAKRAGFQQMVQDALSGKIDLIITKSVSRFARNTVDSLTTVRALKEKGVEVFFEKENIWTLDSKGELLITIMSSLAQEESRSISENVTWGHRRRFQDGKVYMPYGSMLGYDRAEDGTPTVNPEQAALVRRIYQMFLYGHAIPQIARQLTDEGIPTPRGAVKWSPSTIRSILTNEKYKGDALLQKTFTVDFLTKKKKANEGEIPQYYVTGSHEAIIEPELWDAVQQALGAQPVQGKRQRTFTGMVFCEHCGSVYGSKTWHSTSKYKKVVWKCNKRYETEHPQHTPTLTDIELEQAWLAAFKKLIKRQNLIDTEVLAEHLPEAHQPDLDLLEFRPATFHLLTDRITVNNNGLIKVHWKDGRKSR